MNHKNIICIYLTLLMSGLFKFTLFGQLVGPVNSEGYITDEQEFINNLPQLELSPESANIELPTEVDNSILEYFIQRINPETGQPQRELYIQNGNGACAAVATVHYTLTYELNRERELNGLFLENKYPANFTWNFLNNGIYDKGSTFEGNREILKTNGCPNGAVWGVWDPAEYTMWMDGYNKYLSAYSNRVENFYSIVPTYNPDKHELMKHWLAHHNEGAETGGLIFFGTDGACTYMVQLPPESNHADEYAVVEWGQNCSHAMVIVGYCDDIKWDFNGDGQFTNDIDLNNDGLFDVRDWEIGAFNVVHLAADYDVAQEGFVWVMYKTIADCSTTHAFVMQLNEDDEPLIEIKGKLIDNKRSYLWVRMAKGDDANSPPPPSPWGADEDYKDTFLKTAGGTNPMQGIDRDPWLEFSLNYGYHFAQEDFGKIFLRINNYYEEATLEYWSIVDRRWGEVFELEYPETNITIPILTDMKFGIPYDLIPHESYITEDLSLYSNMVSRFTPTVDNHSTLTVEDGVRIDMYNSEIHINSGSSIILEDNVTFLAKTGNCKLVVDGNITFGSDVSFIAEDGAQLELVLNNYSMQAYINYAIFENASLNSYVQTLTISNSTFNNCNVIRSHRGNVTITDETSFNNTWLYLENIESDDKTATVTHCNFTTELTMAAIDLWNYEQYVISNNTIDGYYNGIQIMQSGFGQTKKQTIKDNTITNCTQKGIIALNSIGTVYRNHIYNNRYGVWFGDHSSIKLNGNSGAISNAQTQEILDNDSYEVYASQYSFPIYFRYNVIIDEDNIGSPMDPLVFYGGFPASLKDVRYNCWGQNFDPQEDLYPSGYIWEPIWCPEIGGGLVADPAGDMYEVANNLFDAEDYSGAKIMYESLIDEYPQSVYAKAAMQDLFALEKFVSNDYTSLKQYYSTNSTIQSNPELSETGEHLVSKCDIKLENWPDAINYYENIILSPGSPEDSIFAIIDLGYVYFVMENSNYKSAFCGNLVQYKPKSKEQFFENRDYLLSLIPGDRMSETMKGNIAGLKAGELLQNVPNPFSGYTQIWYKLENESVVQLNVYNYIGQLIRTINEGKKTEGTHFIDFDAAGLKAGIYFYSISIEGQTSDSKKMTVLK